MRTTAPAYKYSGLIAGFGLAALVIGVVLLAATETLRLASWMIDVSMAAEADPSSSA